LGTKPFKIRELIDDEGMVIEERDESRFLKARAGDMLMLPFQCDLCHFRNIMMREPSEMSPEDMEILEYIRRATLDAVWSREPSTVKKNMQGLLRAERTMDRLRLPDVSPSLGPFPLSDIHGMLPAIAVLDRSLDKGLYEEHVQWETFRKQRSSITNVYQASVMGLQDVVGAFERNRCWISRVPTHTFWFTRFMEGLHKRVGEVVKPKWPVPIEVMKEIDEMLNKLWEEAEPHKRKKIAEMGLWFLGGFCTGLRGEEMLMIELAGTTKSIKYLELSVDPHFMFRILGRTKGRQLNGRAFWMPCIGVTKHSGLQPGRWAARLTKHIRQEGRISGRLFQRNLRVPRMMEFEDDFFKVLEMIQSTTKLIEPTVDLREEAGICRSLRRGVTSHTTNIGMREQLQRAINRWRKEINGPANRGGLEMVDRYAELNSLKPTYLGFSKAL